MSEQTSLDAFLDQLVAEERILSGTPVAVIVAENPNLIVSSALQFITIEYNRRLPWSPAQEDVIRQWFGRISRPELTRRVNEVLHRELGTSEYNRTMNSVMNRVGHLGLHSYKGDEDELNVAGAADLAGLPRDVLFRALNQGELPSERKGKRRYVKRFDLANWLVAYREKQLAQSEMLDALAGIELISKKEAMELIDVSETHLTRYLKTGIVTAWKLPTLGLRDRGEWLVEKRSVEVVRAARRSGQLGDLLAESEAYQKTLQKNAQQLQAIRQEKGNSYLGQPDPLTTPVSKYHPGCFTVQQVASNTRQSAGVVYQAIKTGLLEARTVYKGGRNRYGLEPAAAHSYAQQIHTGDLEAGWPTETERRIAEVGLWSVAALAERWHKSPKTVAATIRYHQIPYVPIGRQMAFRPEEIEAFEALRRRYPTRSHREAAEAGLWTTAEVAGRWGVTPPEARYILGQQQLAGTRFGHISAFCPEEIRAFEAERGIEIYES